MTGLRERKKRQTKDAIVDCAGRLFAQQGFGATTIEEIAAASEVSPGTIYNYFGTKNNLLLAHLEHRVAAIVRAADRLLADAGDSLQAAVTDLGVLYVDGLTGIERELLREVFAAGFSPASDVLPELIRFDELLLNQLHSLLESMRHDLRPGTDVGDAGALLYSILGTQLIMYVSVDTISPATLRRSVVRQIRLACAGITAPEGNNL